MMWKSSVPDKEFQRTSNPSRSRNYREGNGKPRMPFRAIYTLEEDQYKAIIKVCRARIVENWSPRSAVYSYSRPKGVDSDMLFQNFCSAGLMFSYD